jgi:hypothetical protein
MAGDERRSDEDAIRELLERQMMGWAAGDAEAYASVFTPDADYVTFLGSHYKGRGAIAALIHAKGAAVKAGRRPTRRNVRVNTTIAMRTEGRWLLAASQSTTHRRLTEKLLGTFASRMSPSPVAGQQIFAPRPFMLVRMAF